MVDPTTADEPGLTATTGFESSPWAPLRQRVFAGLWVGVLISGMGTWMQTLGAQWLLVDAPNATALVSLVQAANTLPVMLLALPSGVLADAFDRRWLLFSVQVYFLLVGTALLVLTIAGLMPSELLLVFTFLLGVGAAVQLPTWQASTPELVPRHQIRSAARLEMVGVNLSRASVYLLPASVLWGLLPLVASRQLGVGAGGYGFMFAALGVGAIAGALVLGRTRSFLSTNGTLTAAGMLMVASLAVLVLVPNFPTALLVLVLAGLSWTTTISTLVAELLLFLPKWVMARGMAIWTMVFTGCQAIGAVLWGLVASQVGITPSFLAGAGLSAVAVGIGLLWRVPDAGESNRILSSTGARPGSASSRTRAPVRSRSPLPTPSARTSRSRGSRPCSTALAFSHPPALADHLLPPEALASTS